MGFGTASISSPRINQLSIQSSSLGLPITLGWGTGRVRCNLIWYNDFTALSQTQKSGGKGGGVKETSYTYTASVIMGLSAGQVVGVPTIYRDKDVFRDNIYVYNWDGDDFGYGSQTALQQAGLNLATGSTVQMPWGYLTSAYPDQALAYRDIAYLYAENYPLNNNAALPNHSFEVSFATYVAGSPDANPKDITIDLLTNANHGLPGWTSGLIGDLTNWSNYCLANNLLLSPVVDSARAARDLINEWCEITNSAAFWSENLLKVGTFGDGTATANGVTYTPDLTPIYGLTETDFIPLEDTIPVSLEIRNQADACNIVQVEFQDRANQYNMAIAPSQDLANINEYGRRKQDPVSWHSICDASIARQASQLLLQRTLYRREIYRFKLPWNFVLLDPMDYVTLTTTTDQLYLTNRLVQITAIEEGEDDCLLFTAEGVDAGSGSSPLYNAYSGNAISVQTQMIPVAVSPPILVNAPSSLTGLDPEVWLAVAGPNSNWGGCQVWISADGVTYENVGSITSSAKIGVSTAILPDSASPDTVNTLSVNMSLSNQDLISSSSSNANSGATLFVLDGEIMTYQNATLTSANNYNLTTLQRGLYGTTHSSHASGSAFARLDEAIFKIAYTNLNFGDTMYVKLPSFNAFGLATEDLSTVTPYSIALLSSVNAVDWRVVADEKTITGFLTNESHTVAAAADGTGYSLTGAGGNFTVYYGTTVVSSTSAFSVVGSATKNGLTISINSAGVYTLSGGSWTTDSETFTLQAVYSGVTIQKDYSISKSRAGSSGAGASVLTLATTAQTFTYDGTGAASPASQTITFTANLQNLAGAPTFTATAYNASGGSLGAITLGGSGNSRTMTNAQFGAAAYAVVTATLSGFSDTVTVVRLQNGTNGTAGLNSATVFLYKRATSTPAVPSTTTTYTFSTGVLSGTLDGWTQTIPAGTDPIYITLATAASTATTDTIPTGEWATPNILSQNGTNGAAGLNNALVYLYQRAASAPAAPSGTFTYTFATGVLSGGTPGSWTQTIPTTDGNPLWVIVASASSNTATDTIAAGEFTAATKLAQDGSAGINNAAAYLYQRAATAPAQPTGTFTYTFATGVLSGGTPGSWTQAIPAANGNPLWIIAATASSNTATDTILGSEFSSAVITSGAGNSVASVLIFQRSATAPAVPSTTLTYTFSTGLLSGTLGSWSQTVPSGTDPLYTTTATASSTGATDTIATGEWATPTILAENGSAGPSLGIISTGQGFVFVDNVLTPAGQSQTLTLIRQNLSGTATFTTSPAVTLTGTGDSRTLSAADFGSNKQVVVTATVGSVSATFIVVRLDQSTAEAGATVGAPSGTNVGGRDADTIANTITSGGVIDTNRVLTNSINNNAVSAVSVVTTVGPLYVAAYTTSGYILQMSFYKALGTESNLFVRMTANPAGSNMIIYAIVDYVGPGGGGINNLTSSVGCAADGVFTTTMPLVIDYIHTNLSAGYYTYSIKFDNQYNPSLVSLTGFSPVILSVQEIKR